MKIKEKLSNEINDRIKKIEDKIKDLYDVLTYHENEIRALASDIVIHHTNHNIPSMYERFIEIEKIEGKINLLDEELCFLYILREDIDIDNEKEL